MKPGLRQIQIVPFRFRQNLAYFKIVRLYSKNLNRTAVISVLNGSGAKEADYGNEKRKNKSTGNEAG
jgi:hypothetical protein